MMRAMETAIYNFVADDHGNHYGFYSNATIYPIVNIAEGGSESHRDNIAVPWEYQKAGAASVD